MPLDLVKRREVGSRLSVAQHDTNFDLIEAAVAELEAADAAVNAKVTKRYVDLRDFTGIDFAGNNEATTDVNLALMQAYNAGYNCDMPAGAIRVGTIRLPTRTVFAGAGAAHSRVLSTGANAPIIQSKNIFASDAHPIEGRSSVQRLRIIGSDNQTLASQHGVVLRDASVTVEGVELEGCGGSAIRLTHLNDAGASAETGSNAQIRNVAIYQNRGPVALQLGVAGNTATTDGLLENVLVSTARTGSNPGYEPVVIANAARWRARSVKLRSYHPTVTGLVLPHTAVHLIRSYHTAVHDLYVEGWTNSAVYVEYGGLLTLDGVAVVADGATNGGTAIYADGNATFGNPVITLDGLGISKSSGTQTVYATTAANSASINVVSPPSREGARLGDVTLYRELTGGALFVPNATGGWIGI